MIQGILRDVQGLGGNPDLKTIVLSFKENRYKSTLNPFAKKSGSI
jgi:hypothetical protein